jgi:putative two-component system hydrogenase maturation factor HypX/HoxX
LANTYLSDHDALAAVLARKATTRCFDEANKPLAAYRKFELTQMYANFYGNDDYHAARKRFVYKLGGATGTPENIAIHRKADELVSTILPGSLGHFVWQDIYQTDDELMDSEHKDLFVLADKLVASANQQELEHNIQIVYQHVKEHFSAEEALMKQLSYRGYSKHINEHNAMLKRLVEIDRQINQHKWEPQNIEIFMDKWGKHIIHSDMVFNTYLKEEMLEPMN